MAQKPVLLCAWDDGYLMGLLREDSGGRRFLTAIVSLMETVLIFQSISCSEGTL